MEVDKEFEKDICFSCSNLLLFVFHSVRMQNTATEAS